jgi:predicted MPP superfamily phosphohydrolase
MLLFPLVLGVVVGSQLYWAVRLYALLKRRVAGVWARRAWMFVLFALYALLWAFGAKWVDLNHGHDPTHWTANELLRLPYLLWLPASMLGFLIAGIVWAVRRLGSAVTPPIKSPARRVFLESAATAAVASPFVAGAYGMFYGRLNLETTHHRTRLPRLPAAFEGFRIAQLSDIHIGPFMTQEQIRKYVAIANALKPDMIVLTGDFVTFDPSTKRDVVEALSGLRAPYGVWGSLGNHDAWARVEAWLTTAFRDAGIRILRHEAVPIRAGADTFNLMGVDFQTLRPFGPSPTVRRFLEDVDRLMAPEQVNILMSHNPDTFDRAAELGVDLSLAGHTHGGQLSLEFISPQIAPSRLVTPYVAGWFEKPGGRLYVNRGIGTIFVPIRVGAPPEITVYELSRA